MSRPLRIDLHVHSTHSPDGRSAVETLVRAAEAAGLGGLALTDHNSTSGHPELDRLRGSTAGLLLVPGVEVSTQEGHLLVYGMRELPPVGRPLAETVDWAIAQGGEPVLAHPFRWPHGAGRHLSSGVRLRAIETVNGHNMLRANARAAELARERALPSTGGSDVHHASELGRAVTLLPEGTETLDGFLEALRRGRVRPEGRSLSRGAWMRWGFRSGLGRIARGLRPL